MRLKPENRYERIFSCQWGKERLCGESQNLEDREIIEYIGETTSKEEKYQKTDETNN